MPVIALSDLQSAVYDHLENNTRFYKEDEITGHINDAIATINLFTGFLCTSEQILAQAGRLIYDIPSTILVVNRVKFDGRDLDPLKFPALCAGEPGWIKETTRSSGSRVSTWTQLGLGLRRKLIIHPGPRVGGAQIEIFGIAEPERMTSPFASITAPNEFTDLIVDLAAHQAMIKNGGAVARDAMLTYKKFLRRMKELQRFKGNLTPHFKVEMTQEVAG